MQVYLQQVAVCGVSHRLCTHSLGVDARPLACAGWQYDIHDNFKKMDVREVHLQQVTARMTFMMISQKTDAKKAHLQEVAAGAVLHEALHTLFPNTFPAL